MRIVIVGSSGPVFKVVFQTCSELSASTVIYGRGKHADHFFDIHNSTTWPEHFDADIVFYLAWDLNYRSNSANNPNVDASKHLLRIAKTQGIRFVFFSSTSAHQQSMSNYGYSKFLVETEVLDQGMEIVKLGFLDGESSQSETNKTRMFLRLIRSFPIGIFVKDLGPIPILSNSFLRDMLCSLIQHPPRKSALLVENWVTPVTFFAEKTSYLRLGVTKSFVDKIVEIGERLHLCPVSIKDRWFSLKDSTFL